MYKKKYLKYKYKYLAIKNLKLNLIGGNSHALDTRIKVNNEFINHLLKFNDINKESILYDIYDKIKNSDYISDYNENFNKYVFFIAGQIFNTKPVSMPDQSYQKFYLNNNFEVVFFNLLLL